MNNINFRPLVKTDLPMLHRWLETPHVKEYWDSDIQWTESLIQQKFGTERKGIVSRIILCDNKPIGFVQYYSALDFQDVWTDHNKTLAALDFYLGEPDYLGKSLGSLAITKLLDEEIFQHFDACLVDPERKNKYALKTYAKAGFTTHHETESTIIMVAKKEIEVNPIIIFGSSRNDGDTLEAIKLITQERQVPIIDLSQHAISYYDYEYRNRDDNFIAIAEKMVKHNPIILATPVYWYTMSATMKTFIDRWSDLLDIRKDVGRRLTGKDLYLVTSYGVTMPKSFEDPISLTCEYMEMNYKGCYYYHSGNNESNISQANAFASKIWQKEPICNSI